MGWPSSRPPPPLPGRRVRKPGLAKCDPERLVDADDVLAWFQQWCRDRGVAERDIQSACHFRTSSNARKKLTGESPLSFADVRSWSPRVRNDLLASYIGWCNAADRKSSSHG